MKRIFLTLAAAGLLACAGCNWLDVRPSPENDLAGPAWRLRAVSFADTTVSVEGDPTYADTAYVIAFEPGGGITGRDLCNHCHGSYRLLPGNRIEIGTFCTQMACGLTPPRFPVSQSGTGFQAILCRSTSYEVIGGALVLHTSDHSGNPVALLHVRR